MMQRAAEIGPARVEPEKSGFPSRTGYSSLDLAVKGNHPEIVCLLLDHHADTAHVNARDGYFAVT